VSWRRIFSLGADGPAVMPVLGVFVPMSELRTAFLLLNSNVMDVQARQQAAAMVEGWLRRRQPRLSRPGDLGARVTERRHGGWR
jgi:hypothetical protein